MDYKDLGNDFEEKLKLTEKCEYSVMMMIMMMIMMIL